MTDTQLILIGIAFTGVVAALVLSVIAGNIGELVKEIRYLRGELNEFKDIRLDVGDALIDKVAKKFGKKKKKSNGR